MQVSEQQLAELLREAKKAHAEYEKTINGKDDEWPAWYAQYIHNKVEK